LLVSDAGMDIEGRRRRAFMGLGGSTLLACAAPKILSGCRTSPAAANRSWTEPVGARAAEEPRLFALSYALLAPSSHNTQPWFAELGDANRIHVYSDPSRRLPHADPLNRQLLVTLGAFIETCSIALTHDGFSVRIAPLADDSREAAIAGKVPVASVELIPGGAPREDSLFSAIVARHTNKRRYEAGRTVPGRDLDVLAAAARREDCELHVLTDRARVQRLAELCREAMTLDVSDPERDQETAAWFRFSDAEIERKRDGFGLSQGGVGGFSKWVAETFLLGRKSAGEPSGTFAKKSVELCWGQASSASAFAWVTTAKNRGSDQLAAGRSYLRVQLAAEQLGIRSQPFSQLLQEYPAMMRLRQEFKSEFGVRPADTAQMLFRLGYAESTRHSPRRPLSELLRRRPEG